MFNGQHAILRITAPMAAVRNADRAAQITMSERENPTSYQQAETYNYKPFAL